MDQKDVNRLESDIEQVIAEVMMKLSPKQFPISPSRQTIHLMSKAAVTVYEAAVENQRPENRFR